MEKEELSNTSPKCEKWFRFRGMCFGKRYGGADARIAVMAPTVKELREKVAIELANKKLEVSYSYVDRVLVLICKNGPVEEGIVRKDALNASRFLKEVQSSETYKKVLIGKISEIANRTKEALHD
jgi:hypothetical protein